ncbi:hypothetical protein DY000_02050117 [Brassica cretica]|uniref:S-locus glycoprotein domain-containing protein n=1 Tax=Brassica cretica TaxID=69181 RepID=A0ABQ7EY79_BRACR|nr:hypothetical protein DY000_02050117 [Brassica cretica]
MKSTTLIMVSCVLMFFILNHVKEYHFSDKKIIEVNGKVCTRRQVFEKNCGENGNRTCIRGFNDIKKYPFSCECSLVVPTESRRVFAYVNFQSLPAKIPYSLITSIALLLCIREIIKYT